MDRQLFILDDRVWDSMSFADVASTVDDMRELDIAYPPVQEFDVMTKLKVVDRIQIFLDPEYAKIVRTIGTSFANNNMIWRFSFSDDLKKMIAKMLQSFDNEKTWVNFLETHYTREVADREDLTIEEKISDIEDTQYWIHLVSTWVLAYLLVALAAKNSVKTVKENKLMKLGIGKKKNNYRYTTTVTIGEITETEGTGEGGGWKVRPHLRRGHIREQRYGPNRQYSKKVFIQPVFVNASEDFINERKAYNVRVAS